MPATTRSASAWHGVWQRLVQGLSPHAQGRAEVDACLCPMMLVDAAGCIVHANAAAVASFGGPGRQPLHGRGIDEVLEGTVRTSDRAPLWPRGSAPREAFECESQDAQQRSLLVRVTARVGLFGSLAGWRVCVRDCTAEQQSRRQLEAALRLLNHDLRAPQSSTLSIVELRRLRQGTVNEADVLSQVEHNAQAALSLADNFVRHVRALQAELRCEPVELNELAAEAIDDVWERSRERRVSVRRPQGPADPVWLVGDAPLLQRALANLLRHAIERSPGGAGIECRVVRSGNRAAFEVTDHGATPAHSLGDAGAGAGLDGEGVPVLPAEDDHALGFSALVARRHGGVLRQRRASTQGLTMSLCLPVGQAEGVASGAAVPDSSSASSR